MLKNKSGWWHLTQETRVGKCVRGRFERILPGPTTPSPSTPATGLNPAANAVCDTAMSKEHDANSFCWNAKVRLKRSTATPIGMDRMQSVASGTTMRQGLTLVHLSGQHKPFWSHFPVFPCLIDCGELMRPMYHTKCACVEPKSGTSVSPCHEAVRRGHAEPVRALQEPGARVPHSFTFRLNVNAFCGIGDALRGCVGGV
jgi:hypothetical protein